MCSEATFDMVVDETGIVMPILAKTVITATRIDGGYYCEIEALYGMVKGYVIYTSEFETELRRAGFFDKNSN